MAKPRILVAPNSYKETFNAPAVAAAMADGVRDVGAEPVMMPLSDGGDGLLDSLGVSGIIRKVDDLHVTGPLGEPVAVQYGWLDDDTAVIESRLVVGLSLVPPERRNPWETTTLGLGELIATVAQRASAVVVGLGGSATMDAGVDMARAWGWQPFTAEDVPTPLGGGGLAVLREMRRGSTPGVRLVGLADVENPLLGPAGAAVYGPQKGASPSVLASLQVGLSNLVTVLGVDAAVIAARPGSGAAGGLGFGLQYFGHGTLLPGAEWVLEKLRFRETLAAVSAVLTGEGAFDATSLAGKTPGLVIRWAGAAGVPVGLLAPRVTNAPIGIHVETGGGQWGLDDIRMRAGQAVRTLFSLPGP